MKTLKFPGANTINKAGLVTLAVNGAFSIDGSNIVCAIGSEASGAGYGTSAQAVDCGQDSQPIQQFTPRYLSQARRGSNMACVVKISGTTQDLNDVLGEFETYSYATDGTYAFVWGTLNFDQIDDGFTSKILDPATAADVASFVMWS